MATELTTYDWTFIRSWVGDAADEVEITERYEACEDVPTTVLLTLQHILATYLESPAQVQLGELSQGTGDNMRALQDRIKDFLARGRSDYLGGLEEDGPVGIYKLVRPSGR